MYDKRERTHANTAQQAPKVSLVLGSSQDSVQGLFHNAHTQKHKAFFF